MVAVFIVTSYWAYGELLIAYYFAKTIAACGYKPYFIIPPSHEKVIKDSGFKYSVLIPKLGKINRLLLADCEHKYKPGLVILADFINYHFCERHYGLTGEDLEVFSGTMGTFDNFHWDLEKREMDTYGFRARNVHGLSTGGYRFRLLPCPLVNPGLTRVDNREFYYSLLNDFLDYDEDMKVKLRKELSLPLHKPICITTTAAWQSTYKQYPHVEHFVHKVDTRFRDILGRVFKNGLLLTVGKDSPIGAGGAGRVIRFDHLSPWDFEKYALASDLFVSRNITSTTLARLALSGLPSAVLINSNPGKDDRQRKREMDYPYRMFPVGWFKFLNPVLKGNPYVNVVKELEIFDVHKTAQGLRTLVLDKELRQECRRQALAFRKSLEKLMKPGEILETLTGGR